MGTLDFPHGLTPPVAALLPSRDFALATAQARLSVGVVPGVRNLRAVSQHGEQIQPHVDTRSAVVERQRLALPFDAEAHPPAARFPLDRDRLALALDRPVELDLDMPRALDTQLAVVEQAAAVSIRRKSDAVITAGRAVPREPRLLSRLHAAKECLVRFIDAAQNILATGEVRERQAPIRTHRLQLVRRVVVVDRLAADLPRLIAFLLGPVIERASLTKFAVKKLGLGFGRVQTVLVREAHSLALRVLDVLAHHGFADRSDRTGIVAAAPQRGKARTQNCKLFAQLVRGKAFQPVHNFRHTHRGVRLDKKADVVRHPFQHVYRHAQHLRFLLQQRLQAAVHGFDKYRAAIFRAPHDVVFQAENRTRVLRVSFHCTKYVFGGSLMQGSNRGGGTFSTASLFRCRPEGDSPRGLTSMARWNKFSSILLLFGVAPKRIWLSALAEVGLMTATHYLLQAANG